MALLKRNTSKSSRKNSSDGTSENTPAGEATFFSFLPNRSKSLINVILRVLFLRVKIEPSLESTVKNLDENGIVVFVNKYKSLFDFLFYTIRFRHEKLPYPSFGFDYRMPFLQPFRRFINGIVFQIGHFLRHRSLPDPYKQHYYRKKLLDGGSALLSLIEEKGLYRRLVESKTDPIDYLIEMQKTITRPIYLVPQLILYDKSPHSTRLSFSEVLFGTRERPGRLRRIYMLLRNPKKIIVEASEPVSLIDFLKKPEIRDLSHRNQVVALRRYLLDQINRHRQSITGPALKSRDEIMEEILTQPEMQKSILNYARENRLSVYQAQKEAATYLDEIAANYNLKVIRLFDVALRWILNHIFDGMVIDFDGLNRVKQWSKKGPLILVPCHKSHLDYLIISYIFYQNNMPCPHIAAGKNLSFWPLGPIFRGGGAFFLRRTFKGEALYPIVFSAYLYKILDEGFHVEFFIEGGRSRTGKLLTPKIGFLSLLLEEFQKGRWNDMVFVPINIGYDRVLEEKAYIHELEGGKKAPENLSNVLKARKFLKKKYGKIYINFHEPYSLKEYIDQIEPEFSCLPREEQKERSYAFGEKIVSAISREAMITPHAVIAGALLNSSRKRLYYKQLMAHAETYMNYLTARNARMADTLFINRQSTFDHVLDLFVQNKYIECGTLEKKTPVSANPIIKVNENKRSNLDYYKNSGAIMFIPGAYTALSILAIDAFQFSTSDLYPHYSFLKGFFKHEYIFDPDDPIEPAVRKNIKAFIDDAILTPHPTLPETFNLTSAGYRKLNLFAAFLTPYFESYWVVLNFYMRYTKKSILDIKDHIKKIQNLGNRMYKRNEISRQEALSKINYKNAVNYFTSQGLVNPENDSVRLDEFVEKLQHYRKFLQG